MRITTILLLSLAIAGCASKTAREETPPEVRFGTISAKETVNLKDVDKKGKSSVFASVSSGGGMSIGLGFLLPLLSKSDDREVIRYSVELKDAEPTIIYHESRNFEVGDCVKISLPADAKKEAPLMERSRDGC